MTSDTDLVLVREFADEQCPPTAIQHAEARARLLNRMARPPGPVRRPRVVVVTAAFAVAAALLTLPVLGGKHGSSSASASTVLRQAARAAGEQAGGWPSAGYWHSVATYRQGGMPQERRESWIGHTSEGSLLDSGLDSRSRPLGIGGFGFGSQSLSWDQVYALPRTADGLERYLADHDRGESSQMFSATAELLQEAPAPPDLRAALFELASRLPGTQYLGQTLDSHGRSGYGLRRGPITYVVDADSGRILEFIREGSVTSAPGSGTPCGSRYVVTYLTQEPTETAPSPTNRSGVSDGGDNPTQSCEHVAVRP